MAVDPDDDTGDEDDGPLLDELFTDPLTTEDGDIVDVEMPEGDDDDAAE